MNFDSVDIFKLRLAHVITILILDADTPVVVELASEVYVVCLLNPEVVASSKSMQHTSLSIIVSDSSCTFHS